MPTSLRTPAAILITWLLAAPAAAAPGASYTEAWRWARFTTASGLPSDSVIGAAKIGAFFWALTRGGAAWFDGYRWYRVPGSPDVMAPGDSMASDGQGRAVIVAGSRLLVGTERGLTEVRVTVDGRSLDVLACARLAGGAVLLVGGDYRLYEWDGHSCRPHEPSRTLGAVSRFIPAPPAGAWAATARGLWQWNGRAWSLRLDSGGAPPQVRAVAEQDHGRALAFVSAPLRWAGLWQWDGEGQPPHRVERLFSAPIEAIAAPAEGDAIVVHNSGEVVIRSGPRWLPLDSPGLALRDARSAGFLEGGDAWIASDHGLFVERRSSTLWRVQAIPRPDDRNTVNELTLAPDGTVLLATGGGVIADSGRSVPDDASLRLAAGLDALTGLAVDRRGRTWATSGYSFTGARWREAAGAWHRATLDPLLDASFLHKVVRDRQGGLWFLGLSTDSSAWPSAVEGPGAFRLRPDGRVERWGRPEGLPSGRVYSFADGPDGAYWFGTYGGLSRWRAGEWRHWTMRDGLRGNRIFSLAVDRRGTVWFTHQIGGLGRLDGDVVRYATTADGLATDAVWTAYVDDQDRVWAGGEGGVSVLRQGAWTSFDEHSGLTSTRVWPILVRDDAAYLGTRGGGLAVLNLGDRATPSPIVVADAPAVDEDGFSIRWRAFAWWGEMAPETILTRARVDQGEWTAWSAVRELRVAALPAGRHEVSFQSKDLLGTINGALPRVAFDIPPPLVRRPAFYVPVGSLALVVGGLVAILAVRQRRHHLELHRRGEQMVRMFQASPLPATITSLDEGRFVEVNEEFVRLTGYSREEVIGRSAAEIHLSALEYDRSRTVSALGAGRPLRGIELTTKRRSGDPLHALGYFEMIEFDGKPSILGQYLDVSGQRRLESQLRQAQKMESIGRLAGGVAHDFNNLLTVIIGNASLVESALPPDDASREGLEQITIAADRAERLTRQLLAFARRQVVEPKIVNLNDLVLGTDRVLRRLIGEDVELVTLTSPGLPPVFADPNQLEQVLWNLAVNARDAMPDGGTLTIRTSLVALGEDEARETEETAGRPFVRLSMTDTGVGMDASVRSRLFEPFFTTKDPGKGTGLGLATCYGIVTQASGHLLVDTAPGRGTTFHVDLPPAPGPREAERLRDRPLDTPGGAETILLVEDEVQVRRLAAAVLRRHGYHVLEAENGHDALQISSSHTGEIALLVTDIVMPLMSGPELAKRARADRPRLEVLFVSGYTDDEAFRQEAGTERVAFLAKPFTPAALARRVRELLDQAGV